ncbi:hypothetical protein [Rhizobium leguminosarum]|uniref:hypothetical protein n=1 Tax=Rhizobium leguminosarum TaxID=384 RepID=UPI00103ECDFA|nr:hypothetical protein [Rhizobium leguminosarum]TBZ99128.1 hypothetical protein E0H57_28660 [Rhizobium leguminosarum bv. viciae]
MPVLKSNAGRKLDGSQIASPLRRAFALELQAEVVLIDDQLWLRGGKQLDLPVQLITPFSLKPEACIVEVPVPRLSISQEITEKDGTVNRLHSAAETSPAGRRSI